MIAHDALQPAAAGNDPFDSAAESGKKMRLDKTGDDADVGLGQMAVDQSRGAVAHGAELGQGGGII